MVTSVRYAGFWVRFLAHLIDFILTNGVELVLEYGLLTLVYGIRKFVLQHAEVTFNQAIPAIPLQVFSVILSLYLLYYYYVKVQTRYHGTLGKRMLKIQVLDAATMAPMSEKQAWLRLLGYFPSYLVLGCGFLMAAFSKEKRALHDVIANTVCIKKL